jgi:hypothetical protein
MAAISAFMAHHANAGICWLGERVEVHRWRKLVNSMLYMKETIYCNKERKKGNTNYMNQNAWNPKMKHNEKQVDNGTAVSNLVFV